MSKIDKLLKVLELRDKPETPEEIQFQSSPLKVWVSQNLFDDPDERNAFYKGHISLADLAFRLRDEAVVEYEDYWGKATWLVYEHITGAKDKLLTSSWFLCVAQPVHWIIAALIAKESNG